MPALGMHAQTWIAVSELLPRTSSVFLLSGHTSSPISMTLSSFRVLFPSFLSDLLRFHPSEALIHHAQTFWSS
jgi:hypothetical protein